MKTENNQVVELDIDLIDQHPKNPHIITREEIDEMKLSIVNNGMLYPLQLSKRPGGRFVAVSGNTRLIANKELGAKTIKAVILDFENEDEELKHLLLSNKYHKKSTRENAAEMAIWEGIFRRQPGQRTDLDNSPFKGDTRDLLAKAYGYSPGTVGKILLIHHKRPQSLDLIDSLGISVDAAFHLTNLTLEKGLALDNGVKMMSFIIDYVVDKDPDKPDNDSENKDDKESTMLEQVARGAMTLEEAFKLCVKKLGNLRKPGKKSDPYKESTVSPPSNSSGVKDEPDENDEPVSDESAGSSVVQNEEQDKTESNNDIKQQREDEVSEPAGVVENCQTAYSEVDQAVYCTNKNCIMFGKKIG